MTASSSDMTEAISELLTSQELVQLQELYEYWIMYTDCDGLIPKFYSNLLLTKTQKQLVMSKVTTYDRNDYLHDSLLSRGTYSTIVKVGEILLEHAGNIKVNHENIHARRLAMMLPSREDIKDTDSLPPPLPPKKQSGAKFERNFSIRFQKSKLGSYAKHPTAKNGHGLCVIITSFTEFLPSYMKDEDSITNFFGKELGYKVVTFPQNPTKEQFLVILETIQIQLNDACPSYDHFVFFWHTKGKKDGYRLSQDKRGNMDNDKILTLDIVKFFTHDQIPSLQGRPKLFFFQSSGNYQNAYDDDLTNETEVVTSAGNPKLPIILDTMICFAAKPGTVSFVTPTTGSWFIQTLIHVFNIYYKDEHVLDMMTEVNRTVSDKASFGSINHKGEYVAQNLHQFIEISHNLSHKFYL